MIFAAVTGIALIAVVLWDAFESIILPRRVIRRARLARLYYRNAWRLYRDAAALLPAARYRETYFSYFGPLSLIVLIGLWAIMLVVGFAMLHLAAGSAVSAASADFWTDLYLSGTTFFTLGLGDVAPVSSLARALTVIEAGMGFGFLALVIGYLPALNQSFSRREVGISLLDARAGSPATAAEMLKRHTGKHGLDSLTLLLADWERWSAELMESHLSYPVLAYFRSQHENQSWLGALTTILDTCALVMVGTEGACERQARLTFAITRHALLDLAHVFGIPPQGGYKDRLPPAELTRLREFLSASGVRLREGEDADRMLNELRGMYEPYVHSFSRRLLMSIPPWMPEASWADNWQTSAWRLPSGPRKARTPGKDDNRHF